jgi:hypothetical protein
LKDVVIQASHRGGEYKFFFSREGCVYFNIRGKKSVIQTSFRGGEMIDLLILLI